MRFARTPGNVFFQMYSCQSLDKVLQHAATICNLLASVGTFSRWNCQGHMRHIARTSGSWFAPLPLEAFPSSMVNSLHHTQILWIMAGHGRCPRSQTHGRHGPWSGWAMLSCSVVGHSQVGYVRRSALGPQKFNLHWFESAGLNEKPWIILNERIMNV